MNDNHTCSSDNYMLASNEKRLGSFQCYNTESPGIKHTVNMLYSSKKNVTCCQIIQKDGNTEG